MALARILDISPVAVAVAMGIVTVGVLVAAYALYVKSRNANERSDILIKGEVPKRRKYGFVGPKTRTPKYFPGTKIPFKDFQPVKVDDIKAEARTGVDRVDEIANAGHAGGFVPSDQMAAVKEAIEAEKTKLRPQETALEAFRKQNSEVTETTGNLEERKDPYDEVTERAEQVKGAAEDAARRLAAEVSVATEAAKAVRGQIDPDPRVEQINERQSEGRKHAALAGFDVDAALAQRVGREPETDEKTAETSQKRRPRMPLPKFLKGMSGRGNS